MKRVLPVLIVCLLFLGGLPKSYSEVLPQLMQTQVSGLVGQFDLSVAGYISPYANIVLTTADGTLLRSTVADSSGNFSISDVRIQRGLSGFCLEAIDFKRIGESTTCFSTAPATSSIVMKDIFLPPTLGLYRNQIAAGSTAISFGYTMPHAKAILHVSSGEVLGAAADATGYYRFDIKGLSAGVYRLFSTAEYKNRMSLSPSKALELTALSTIGQIILFLKELWDRLIRFLTSIGLDPLWVGLPLIILIIILILKLWPEKFTAVYESKLLVFVNRRRTKRLHHWWFVGY